MARIIQISDTHIVAPPQKLSPHLDSVQAFQNTVERIKADLPKIGPVDAVLISGDVTDLGRSQDYALFRDLIAPLGLPFFVIPGNHDVREAMRAAFARDGYLPANGPLNWSAPIGDMHMIGVDTLLEGQGGGTLCAETLAFLERSLAQAGQNPVVLAMHHPPFVTGIRFMDAIGLDGIAPLRDILNSSAGEVRIACGHVHSMHIGMVGRSVAISCPATCSTFAADFSVSGQAGYFTAPGGYLVHDWSGSFRSVEVGPDIGAGPYPF